MAYARAALAALLIATPAAARQTSGGAPAAASEAKGAEGSKASTSATSIRYTLPTTSVKATIGYTLVSCSKTLEVKTTISFTSAVSPSPNATFTLEGKRLSSFWKSNKVAVETYGNGTIKSINGGIADQTGAIVTSAIKVAAAVLAFDAREPVSITNNCNKETTDALARLATLKTRIQAMRGQLEVAPLETVTQLKTAIDAVAGEIARMQTDELHLDLELELVPSTAPDGIFTTWTAKNFSKWLDPKVQIGDPPVRELQVGFCILQAGAGDGPPGCTRKKVEEALIRRNEAQEQARGAQASRPAIDCADDAGCATTLVLREPVASKIFAFSLQTDEAGKKVDKPLKTADVQVAQWGSPTFLPLKVGFAKSLNLAMGFDENGHKTSQTWDATARGATLLGAASSVTDAATTAYRTIEGARLAEQKAEVDRVTTLKSYNQAKYCEAFYAAGGYTCP